MNRKIVIAFITLLIFYIIAKLTASFFIDYEWFKANDGLAIFWVMFFTKFNVQIIFGCIFIILFMLNFIVIRIIGGKGRFFSPNFLDRINIPIIGNSRKFLLLIMTIAIVFAGFLMGGGAAAFWKEYLLFKNAVPFEGFPVDPIFGRDISFYVFILPFFKFLYGWLMTSLVIIVIFSFFLHIINGGISILRAFEMSPFSRAHISILLGLIVILYGLSYQIAAYDILFSHSGKFYGAGYSAVNAKLIAYRVAQVLSFIAAALLFFNVFIKSFRLPVIVLLVIIPLYFILGTLYPSLLQRFVVIPNELDKEKPYIQNNITFTRIAYKLDKIKEIPFENKSGLSYNDLRKNIDTIESVRLWDWRPLHQTYKQLQELKQYYRFNDVDVDRYLIEGKNIAVNLSARELSIEGLGANTQTWQNKHLIYTHGYGLAMSRVDRVTPDGLPEFLIKDIPPKSFAGISVDRPEIYYGEGTDDYVITNTSISPGEFDYPSGDENKYTSYQGTGGIKLDSFFKRFMAAVSLGEMNILISGNINSESRLHIKRNITEIAKNFVPFLKIDSDPYLVVSQGKLYWIIDCYSSTDMFPYSTPVTLNSGDTLNYIRNSVKIIIDAYNGKINCYIADEFDPLIKAYSKIFPGIFKNIKEIPEDLKKHIRYPENIFDIQSHILLRYHMTNSNVFYNNEDLWSKPTQIYENSEAPVESYYLVTRLPNESKSEFILILPFTPYSKNNMIGFLAAKCDMPDYGNLQLYLLPKDKLSYGPMQIEARINQDPEISKQLTLWNQKGSAVIRGNMLAIPVEESIIYIETLYLKAETSEMPELKKVIVAFADKIAMEQDLQTALKSVFYGGFVSSQGESQESISELADKAYYHYEKAQENLKNSNWKGYGEELENLKRVLLKMKSQSKK